MNRRTYVASLGVALGAGCLGQGGSDEEETRTGTDETGTGSQQTVGFEKQWETGLDVDDNITKIYGLSLVGETAYAGVNNSVTSVSLSGGKRGWQWNGENEFATMAANSNGVFVADYYGSLSALDPADGSVAWTREDIDESEPLVTTADHVAFSTFSGPVAIYNSTTGEETGRIADNGVAGFVPWDGQIVVSKGAGVAGYTTSGTRQWRVPDANIATELTRTDEYLVGTNDAGTTVTAVDLSAQEVAWTSEFDGAGSDTSVATGSGVAVLSSESVDSTVRVLDLETGAERWTVETESQSAFGFQPVVLDSAVLLQQDGTIQARDHESGEVLATTPGGLPFHAALFAVTGRTLVKCDAAVTAYHI